MIFDRLLALGVHVRLDGADVVLSGAVTDEIVPEVRRAKPALVVELLRRRARGLKDFIDGDSSYEERIRKMAEYQETVEKLQEAEVRLFDSWKASGFTVLWSVLLGEFLVVGDGPPPAGSEDFTVYTWSEVEALKDAAPDQVKRVHQIKRAFAGRVETVAEKATA